MAQIVKRWTLPDLIQAQIFGIIDGLPEELEELEPLKTIEYEYDLESDNPKAWLKTENYRQKFFYSHIKTILQVFRNSPLYLSPKSSKANAHLLVISTSYKTYGVLTSIKELEEAGG